MDTHLSAISTDDVGTGPMVALQAAGRVATGRGRSPLAEIRRLAPDVVHVHNLFPNFGRRWVNELAGTGLVATLHNFRPICAKAILYRDGQVCRDCPDGDRWSGVRHRCYRDSALATLPIAIANRNGPMADPLLARADRLAVMSEIAREEYLRAGVPTESLVVAPNFLPDDLDPGASEGPSDGSWLFVGRLDHTKGIVRLLEVWPPHQPLRVVGTGPLEVQAREAAAGKDVDFRGRLPRGAVIAEMKRARGIVFPSPWLEGSPLVLIEALACGLPILAFEPNVAARVVRDHGVGMVATIDRSLGETLATAQESFPALRARCRRLFEEVHSERAYLDRTLRLYQDVAS